MARAGVMGGTARCPRRVRAVDALSGGRHVSVTVLRGIALALGAVLPVAAFAAPLTLRWLRCVRPRLPRRREPAPATTALSPAVGPPGAAVPRRSSPARTDMSPPRSVFP
ncbi:hypothetical protein AB0C13_27400 [Streptomyces sp. NPDC049099]|uniref:hypothetical protein n=1 Tax=Streptomyces sp. NPDC049099 TaxID=3155768 RepID=UPI00341D8290